MRWMKWSAAIATALGVGVAAQAAETIVDFTHINGQSSAGDPDSRTTTSQTWDFSDTTPLVSDGETGTDSNTRLYGGMYVSWSPTNDTYGMTVQLRINQGLVLQVNPLTEGRKEFEGCLVWNKEDFLNLSTDTVLFDADSSMSVNIAQSASMNVRYLVNDGGTYYVSDTSVSGTGLKTLGNPEAEPWAVFNTNDNSWGTFDTHEFTDIQGVGFYIKAWRDDTSTGQIFVRIDDFQVSASHLITYDEFTYLDDFEGAAGSATVPEAAPSGFGEVVSSNIGLDGQGRLESSNAADAEAGYGFRIDTAPLTDEVIRLSATVRMPMNDSIYIGFNGESVSHFLEAGKNTGPFLQFTENGMSVSPGPGLENQIDFANTHTPGQVVKVTMDYYQATGVVHVSFDGEPVAVGVPVAHEFPSGQLADPIIGWMHVQFRLQPSVAAGGAYLEDLSIQTFSLPLPSPVKFANIFANGCVLQRDETVTLWGTATPYDTITVEIKGQSKQGVANALGLWRVELDPESAGGPYTLTATGASGSAELAQVYFGDVWLFTGQSNMEQTVARQYTLFPGDYPEVPNASDDFDDMHFAIVDFITAEDPADDVSFHEPWTRWQQGDSLNELSAVGYFFARALNEQMDANGMADIPLGFISISKGGTSIEEWIPESKLDAVQAANGGQLDLLFANNSSLGGRYNGMIAPLKGLAVKGAIWYQGENNTRPNGETRVPQYAILKEALLESWRAHFNNPDMPFYFVQLAAHQTYTPSPTDELWAWMREQQTACLEFPHTGMACFIDGGYQGEIHPPGKDRVGERLARLALDQTYGISMVHRGPTLQDLAINGSAVTLTFDHVASGLETRAVDSQPDADESAAGFLPVSVSADELAGFFLCGADKKFYPVREAVITASNQVRLSNTIDVPSPVAVRYAFQDYPRCNLFNSEGLPAEPFRTDTYAYGEATAGFLTSEDASKPTSGVLAQSNPDGDALMAFDSEERTTGDRYAWGQSFTVPSGEDWEVDSISVQYYGDSMADPDAKIKLVLFDYDSATFDAEAWGTYTDPLSGMATTPRYTEEFPFTTSPNQGDWIHFDLATDQTLPAGSYGFALWLSSPTAGAMTLMHGGIYDGGERLRVQEIGNSLPNSDFNFVIQSTNSTPTIDPPIDPPTPGASVTASASKPTDDLLAESNPDGTALLAFDAEEKATGDRYAWGQSFTVPAGESCNVDSISLQYYGDSIAHSDAKIKLILFDYNAATFDAEAWGTYTDPLSGMATTSRYTEEFSFTTSPNEGDWITFDLSEDQSLQAGTYGFVIWLSSPTAGGMTLMHGGTYEGGQRLRVQGSAGNTAPSGSFNFVIQQSFITIPEDLLEPSITSSVSEVSFGESADLTIQFDTNATSAVLQNSITDSVIDLLALDDGDGVVVVPVTPDAPTEYTVHTIVEGFALDDSFELLMPEFLGFASSVSVEEVSGRLDVTVASSDFQNDTDNGLFLNQTTLSGDFQVETFVHSVDAPVPEVAGAVYPWAKAGLMVRETNDVQSRSAGVYFTPARGALFQSRRYVAGESTHVVEDALGSSGYVRVTRVGDALYGAASSDGQKWTSFGKQTWADIDMSASLIAGVGVAGQHGAMATASVDTLVQHAIGLYDLTLVDNGTDLRSFYQGDLVDLDYYKNSISIRADVSVSVQSVEFRVDGALVASDSAAPFTFDLSGLSHGEHLLEVVPFDASGALDSLCVNFDVIHDDPVTMPNILYIHCDDLGYADTGFNGSQYIFTPELDKLAESGTRCTAGYVTAPQCGPSRAGMISGMHQARFGYYYNDKHRGLPEKAVAKVAPEILKDLGYTNAMIGKWHIEQDATTFHNAIPANETNVLPWYRGFDYTYAMDGGSCIYFPYAGEMVDPSNDWKFIKNRTANWVATGRFDHRNLEVLEGSHDVNYLDLDPYTYQTTEFTTRAIDFIDRNKSNPFFVYLSYNAPHTPVQPSVFELRANDHLKYDAQLREFGGAMTGVDREMGRLMDYMESENLLENTIIFFFSDNGGETPNNKSINEPFSGRKGNILEGGIRVPFLVSWKGHIPKNRDFHNRVCSIDYITSILHHQRRSIPDYLDGQPIIEDLQGKTSRLSEAPRYVVWGNQAEKKQAVIRGRYKKLINPGSFDYHVDLLTNIKENQDAPPLDPVIVAELDQLMDDFNAHALNAAKQDQWFDASDTDGDGLLDSWENDIAGNLTTLGAHPADADGDGQSDEHEKAAGTDPLDPTDRLLVSMVPPRTLSFNSIGRRCYQVQSSSNLVSGTWSDEGAPLYGDEQGVCSLDSETEEEIKFYRIQLKD